MKKPLGIYIHIPFCVRRCPYCGFYSKGVGSVGYEDCVKEYFDCLHAELRARAKDARALYFVDSIYFGGGTPSLADPEYIQGMTEEIKGLFDVTDDAEISMEANPGTLTMQKLKGYREAGVNRLSIGLQSFDDNVLKTLGRIHTAEDFVRSYEQAREAGFDNISADLMFGVPGQSVDVFRETVERLASMLPEHISFYSLQIEEGTKFYQDYKMGDMVPVTDEEDREMYHSAIRILREHGYSQYEISNAALPGRECRHNLKYWTFGDYLGIGASASSFVGGVRRTDPSREYGEYIKKGMPDDMLPENHVNSLSDSASEYMITGLRLNLGIDESEFESLFGGQIWDMFPGSHDELKEFFEEGYIKEENGRIRITEEGFDISNRILECFV